MKNIDKMNNKNNIGRMNTNSKSQYRYWARRFLRESAVSRLRDASFEDMSRFFLSLADKSPRTVWNAWNAIYAAFHAPTVWPELSPDFREQFERDFLSLRPRKLPKTLPLCDTIMISPDEAERWLTAVSPASLRLACWLCYDPGLEASFVAGLTLDVLPLLAVPDSQQDALTQQIQRAKAEQTPYLFFGRDTSQPVKPLALSQALRRAAVRLRQKGVILPTGAGFRLLRAVGIVRRLREDGADPNQVMREAGMIDRQAFQRYVVLV